MDVMAIAKYVKISPDKAHGLARRIRGLPVAAALNVTDFSNRKAAFFIGKTLKSAVANARNNNDLSVDDMVVKDVIIGESVRLKRYWPRARGSTSPIKKKTSHIKIVLTDGRNVKE